MTSMKYLPLCLLLAASAQAAELSCVGKDPTDAVINVTLDLEKNLLIVNDEENTLVKPGKKELKSVVAVTDPYATKEYGNVYITLVKKSDMEYTINQVKFTNKEIMSSVDLACKPAEPKDTQESKEPKESSESKE